MDASLEVARRFGANLRRARRRTGLSQEEVGFRASLHRTEIGLLERGARVPRIDTLVKVSAAVGVRVDCALLEGIAWNAGSTSTRPGTFSVPGRAEAGADGARCPGAGGGVSGPSWSHRSKEQRQTPNETEASIESPRATDSGVLGIAQKFAATPSRPLIQPLRNTNPGHPTHYEPPGSVPGAHFPDLENRQGDWRRFRQGGRRPILARLRRADGREYGRPGESDLRSPAYLELGLFGNSAGHFTAFSDVGGMERNTAPSPTFFTERTPCRLPRGLRPHDPQLDQARRTPLLQARRGKADRPGRCRCLPRTP